MFYRKEGMPQESEIVMCTVTKVQYHSVFVSLDAYGGKSAMLHISEISPGRIRNINDFVKVGKVIVCKVLKIDDKKGHVDVSLRRVNENQRREKVDTMKQEQKSEKIVEFVSKELKKDVKKQYDKIFKAVKKKGYDFLHEAFNDVVTDEFDLTELKLADGFTKMLEEIIRQRIKPPAVEIKAKLHVECYASDGVNKVKEVLMRIADLDKEKISVHYLGGGSHAIDYVGENYDELEPLYDKMESILESQEKSFEYKLERV